MTKEIPNLDLADYMQSIGRSATYHVEGTDCVGKDSCHITFTSDTDIPIRSLNLTENNPYVSITDGMSPDHPMLSPLIAQGIMHDIEKFDPTEPIIQISFTAYRSAAYTAAFGKPLAPVFEDLLKYVPLFGRSILLHASIDEKQSRLKARNGQQSQFDKQMFTEPERFQRMDNIMLRYGLTIMDANIIDTSIHTLPEVQEITKGIFEEDITQVQFPINLTASRNSVEPLTQEDHLGVIDIMYPDNTLRSSLLYDGQTEILAVSFPKSPIDGHMNGNGHESRVRTPELLSEREIEYFQKELKNYENYLIRKREVLD